MCPHVWLGIANIHCAHIAIISKSPHKVYTYARIFAYQPIVNMCLVYFFCLCLSTFVCINPTIMHNNRQTCVEDRPVWWTTGMSEIKDNFTL